MVLEYIDALFLGIWAFIGSVLGFFAFTNSNEQSPRDRIKRCCLSIGIGLFIAFPITIYLLDTHEYSKHLSIMLGGLGAFGLPDFIIKYWPKLTSRIADRVVDNTLDEKLGHHHPHHERYRDDE